MAEGPHLSLSLSRQLWNELLGAALPVQMAGDRLDLVHNARRLADRLGGVRQRVYGLLEDARAPRALVRWRDQARSLWHRNRESVYERLNEIVRVDGEWRVDLDSLGTELRYGHQRVSADAYVRGIAEGTIWIARENLEIPFRLERRLGASVALADIHYDPEHRAVIGSLQDLAVYVGENRLLKLVSGVLEYGLEQQLPRVGPIPILRRDQVEDIVGPMGGSLRVHLAVDDVDLIVSDDELTLQVRFGFEPTRE